MKKPVGVECFQCFYRMSWSALSHTKVLQTDGLERTHASPFQHPSPNQRKASLRCAACAHLTWLHRVRLAHRYLAVGRAYSLIFLSFLHRWKSTHLIGTSQYYGVEDAEVQATRATCSVWHRPGRRLCIPRGKPLPQQRLLPAARDRTHFFSKLICLHMLFACLVSDSSEK